MIEMFFNSNDKSLPFKHRVGKLVIGGIAGLAATMLAEKGYDGVLECYRMKKAATSQ